ncbi:MAG: hypothetical protein ACE5JS_19125, partial [Nitrospinota bacterium]
MPELRFRGLAKTNNRLDEQLSAAFGYKALRDGEDWVVPANDRALREGPKPPFEMHTQVTFEGKDPAEIASELMNFVPSVPFDTTPLSSLPKVDPIFGILPEIADSRIALYLSSRTDAERILRDFLIPRMIDSFHSRAVIPITIDLVHQQRVLSLVKIALLFEKFDVPEAQNRVFNRRSFEGILPDPLEILGYVEALTRLSLLAFTLPLHRWACTWHFVGPAVAIVPHILTEGVFQNFLTEINPVGERPDLTGFDKFKNLDADDIWRYVRIVIGGLNRLLRFANDPKNFTKNGTTEIDFLKQLQFHCQLRLIF